MFNKTFIKNASIFTSIILLGIVLLYIHNHYEDRYNGTDADIEQQGSTLRAILEGTN